VEETLEKKMEVWGCQKASKVVHAGSISSLGDFYLFLPNKTLKVGYTQSLGSVFCVLDGN